jgi:hypothetical protein
MVAEKGIVITKRQRFIVVSAITLALSVLFPKMYGMYGMWSVVASVAILYLLSLFSLNEDIKGVEYFTLFVLPVSFFLGANLFISILPDRKIYHVPFYAVMAIGMYTIYLTENIFNVAAVRTIQLLRAAHAVSYLVTLITAFFLLSFILSIHLSTWLTVILITLTIFILTIQFLWSFDLIEAVTRRTLLYSMASAIIFSQITIMITFYPQTIALTSLFLIAVYYVMLGILQHYYEKKLTRRPTIEYVIVAFIVFVIMILTSPWIS